MQDKIISLEKERMKWSLETFPKATAFSSLQKLKTEIKEIETDLENGKPDAEEYADGLMCLFDSAGRAGIGPEAIIEAFEFKLNKNKGRKWKENPDNTYSHIK